MYAILKYLLVLVTTCLIQAIKKIVSLVNSGIRIVGNKGMVLVKRIIKSALKLCKIVLKFIGISLFNLFAIPFAIIAGSISSVCFLISSMFTAEKINLNEEINTDARNEFLPTDSGINNSDSLIGSNSNSHIETITCLLPNEENTTTKFTSKLKKCDVQKISPYDAAFWRFVYKNAASHGSKIPRINALNEELN